MMTTEEVTQEPGASSQPLASLAFKPPLACSVWIHYLHTASNQSFFYYFLLSKSNKHHAYLLQVTHLLQHSSLCSTKKDEVCMAYGTCIVAFDSGTNCHCLSLPLGFQTISHQLSNSTVAVFSVNVVKT